MKYYSELLEKVFNSADECEAAEMEAKEKAERERLAREEKAAKRKEAAAQVEAARKVALDAQKAYQDALKDFCAKYGSYHTTITNLDDLVDWFFKI